MLRRRSACGRAGSGGGITVSGRVLPVRLPRERLIRRFRDTHFDCTDGTVIVARFKR